jgi:hypothetical protein
LEILYREDVFDGELNLMMRMLTYREGFRLFTVDTTGARRLLKALSKASQTGKLPDTEWRQVLKSGGYELFFAHHNHNPAGTCTITPELFGEMIRSLIENNAFYSAPHDKAAGMRQSFENALQQLPQLQRNLEQLSKSDWADNALRCAAEWLPEDARIEATIFILLDGVSNGYVDHNRIAFDLLQYNGVPESLEGPAAHELHRIGYQSLCDPELLNGTVPESIAYRLASTFLAEGCATAFVSGLPGPQDPDYAAWQDHVTRLPEYFALMRDYLAGIAAGDIPESQFATDVSRLYMRGVACVMGVTMVQTVWKAFSKGGVFHCLRNTGMFFDIYRRAIEQLRAEGVGEGLFDL